MAQKYYNSKETAEVLGKSVDEVKRMLERRELHGYRDGADWKFKVDDIDRLAQDLPPQPPSEEEEVGDVLLSEASLGQADPGLSGTVIGMGGVNPIVTDSDIRLAESDIQLGDETQTPIPKSAGESDGSAQKFETLDLSLEEELTLADSSVSNRHPAGDGSTVELAGSDDDLVLGGSAAFGSDVTIGGDSGISLVDPSDSGLSLETPINLGEASDGSLELAASDIIPAAGKAAAAPAETDDDFTLTPLEEVGEETAAPVAALETEDGTDTIGGASMAAMLDEDLSGSAALDLGDSLGDAGALGQPGVLADGAPLVQPATAVWEAAYTRWQLIGLGACAFLLTLCGMMMYDLLRNIWSWNGAHPVNSAMMDTVLGWFGL